MTSDEKYPSGAPTPRVDSFEIVEAGGPELVDEECEWPVVALQPRTDSFEVIDPTSVPSSAESVPEGTLREGVEVVIRVRCAASATPAEVSAFVDHLCSAVEGVRASVPRAFPVQISLPASTS